MSLIDLGSAFAPRESVEDARNEDVERVERLLLAVHHAVAELRGTLASLPAPRVDVAAPDLAEIVNAVKDLKPGQVVSAEEIGRAVAGALQIPAPADVTPALQALLEKIDQLDFRVKGMPAFGASGPSNISDNANRELGRVTVKNLTDVEVTVATGTISSTGDTTAIAAPGVGQAIRLRWVYAMYDPDSSNSPRIIVKSSGGTEYFRGYSVSKTWTHTLPENEAVVINLDQLGDVSYTLFYETVAV